jgi:hypothetical protein
MADEKKAIATVLDALLEMHTTKNAARGAKRKAMVTAESLRALTRSPRDFQKLVEATLDMAEKFMAKVRERRKALQLVLLEHERALCVRATRANSQPPPVLTSRRDRRVQAAKTAAAEEANKLVDAARKGGSKSANDADALGTAISKLHNLGVDGKTSAKLGYFLGRRQVSATASAAEKALAQEGLAARDMLMEQFHKAALGQQEDFLGRVAKRVGDALQGMTDKKAMMREAKEILRDEFALMRSNALDTVLADPKMTRQLEALGFKVKNWDEVKHLKNAKYLPRLFFEAEMGGKVVRIGFDIDHAGIGFAESRTSFVEDMIQSGAKADKELLRPIFDQGNFTLETARHNRRYLEGVRAEGERFEAAQKAAKVTVSSGKARAANVMALREAAAEGLQNLKDLDAAALRLQQMRARLSMMEDSAAKRELMDSLAELSSILGDTL